MENARISIVIPTKNEVNYLGATLQQFVEHLEALDLELIVSDAYSTDGTAELVIDYAARHPQGRIRLVQAPGRQNIAIGRNYGAAHATGAILLHMDADVRVPDPARFIQDIRSTFCKPDTVAATVPLWIYPDESLPVDRFFHGWMNAVIPLTFRCGIYLAKGECQLVRRSAFEAVGGYNEQLVAGEDCNLFYRLHKTGRIAYLRRLRVYHSPRRFRALGYSRVLWVYFREALSLLFRGKSYVGEWQAVR